MELPGGRAPWTWIVFGAAALLGLGALVGRTPPETGTEARRPALILAESGVPPAEIGPFAAALTSRGFAVRTVTAPEGELADAADAALQRVSGPAVVMGIARVGGEAALGAAGTSIAARVAILPGCTAIRAPGPALLVTAGPEAGCAMDLMPGTERMSFPRPAPSWSAPAGSGAWHLSGRADATSRRRAAAETADWLASASAQPAADR